MITISDTLLTEDVCLDLVAESPADAIERVARLLKDDERIVDWNIFYGTLLAHPPCRVDENSNFSICIPHARTGAVSEMVISAGRLASELMFPGCSKPVRYLFCIGVPQALASDYLRVAGSLMRIFKDSASEAELSVAKTPTEFVAALTRLERKL